MYKQLEEHYLKLLGAENIIRIIEESVVSYNGFIDKAKEYGYESVIGNGRSIGSIMEMEIAKRININGFKFKQGKEASNDKDFECISYGHRFNKKFTSIIGDIYNPHNYGIELKCSSGYRPVGNRGFAVSDNKQKSKNSFYLCITNIKKDNDYHISSYKIWFIYVEQRDWLPCREGGGSSCSIMHDVWNDRVIRLK